MRAEGTAAVHAEALVKHYSGRSGAVEAVRGVDLTVDPGEVFGFLVDRVPPRAGLRRIPAAELPPARRVVRNGCAVSRGGDRGWVLRQAPRGARPAIGDRARP